MLESFRQLSLDPKLLITLAAVGTTTSSPATWQDDIGYTALKTRLGNLTPTGSGVGLTQVESQQGANYLPEFSTSSPIAGTGGLLGKIITDASALDTDSAISSHARTVAGFCYSNNPEFSLATGVSEIKAYEAQHWLDAGFLRPGQAEPLSETSPIQNHSWIGSGSNTTLRRFDFAIQRDRFVALVGLGNDPEASFPDLLASSYNAISVGRSDGLHSTGGTPADLDGPGRTKPEIVVPQSATSWATAIASSAAALLLETAHGSNSLSAAANPETIKAILMAGASKSPFDTWTRTPSRPVDHRFGAGQMNIDNSHRILTSGKQPPGETNIPTSGWAHTRLVSSAPSSFSFTVPDGYRIAELTASAAWNRSVIDSDPGPAFAPSPVLPNVALALTYIAPQSAVSQTVGQSVSPVDNFEHLFLLNRPAGTYTIEITTDRSTAVALAWRYRLERESPFTITSLFRIPSTGEIAIVWPASPGRFYTVQKSTDLKTWRAVPGSVSLPASLPEMVFIDNSPTPDLSYYRVTESSSQPAP